MKLASLCIILIAFVAPARADLRAALDVLPEDVDFALVAEDLAGLAQTPAADALHAAMRQAFGGDELDARWSELSKTLGLSEPKAFAELLGRRVALVGSGLWSGDGSWVALAEVTAETEKRLRARLKVAPRTIVGGRPVYSIENGRFELVTMRSDDRSLLLVTPSDDRRLFERMAPSLGRRAPSSLLMSEPIGRLDLQRRDRAVLYVRGPAPLGGGWMSAAWRFADEAPVLAGRVIINSPMELPPVRPWALSELEPLESDALLAVMGRRLRAPAFLRAVEPLAVMSDLGSLDRSPAGMLGGGERQAIRLTANANGGMSLGVGIEATDIAQIAPEGDRLALRFGAALSGDALPEGVGADLGLGGQWPGAVRTVDWGADRKRGSLLGEAEVTLHWRYVATPLRAPTEPRFDMIQPGWMALGTSRHVMNEMAEALTAEQNREALSPWLSAGVVRPAAVAGAMRSALEGAAPEEALKTLELVRLFRWQLSRVGERTASGRFLIELSPAGGPRE